MQDSPVSRRSLLGSAAAAFTIIAPQSVRGSQANSKISVGLIGTGNRGSYDAKLVNADPRARVTALCDLFDDRMEKATAEIRAENPKLYKDFEKLLAAPDIDAVIIATPPFEHPRMLTAAVESKKHIYCEKPMGVDVAGAKKCIAASRRQDPSKNLFVGFQQRYGANYIEAYNRLTSGQIGELANARAFWIANDPFTRVPYPDPKIEKLRNWFAFRDLSGDFIVEQDCHNLDVLHWFLGARPISAVGMGGAKIRKTFEILDHMTVAYEFPNGIHVNFEGNQLSPRGFRKVGEEFTGTKGVLQTSRERTIHMKGPRVSETIPTKHPDITQEAFEKFLENIETGKVENIGERSSISTLVAILGRTAVYKNQHVTWKGEFGDL